MFGLGGGLCSLSAFLFINCSDTSKTSQQISIQFGAELGHVLKKNCNLFLVDIQTQQTMTPSGPSYRTPCFGSQRLKCGAILPLKNSAILNLRWLNWLLISGWRGQP